MSAQHTLIVVSGLSGSGKSVVLKTFEDLEFYCLDNLPIELLSTLIQSRLSSQLEQTSQRLAVVIDIRSADAKQVLGAWRPYINTLNIDATLLFFEASEEALLKRYADTRRRHPLSRLGLALPDAIRFEQRLMAPLRANADKIIDTSHLNVHQLRRHILTTCALHFSSHLSLLFESFAYKYGIPSEADYVFDARVLTNPHWEPHLKALTGRDQAVVQFLQQHEDVRCYCSQITALLDTWLPRLRGDTRSYVTVAFGCTGGKHRSVYLAEYIAQHARQQGWPEVTTYHRELA